MTDYYLGAKPDRYDPRDYSFRTLMGVPVAEAAKAVDRKFYSMVNPDFRLDQGNEGTCVGHAITNVLTAGPSPHPTFADFTTTEKAHQFARGVYLDATGDSTYQDGAYPRDACDVILKRGLIDSYWRVETVDDIITCLLTYGPVSISVPWYGSMFYVDGTLSKQFGNYWIKVNLDSTLAGYHEIALTGIDMAPDNGAPPFVRVENSWGKGWGWDGTARLAVDSLRRLNLSDNWTFAEKEF